MKAAGLGGGEWRGRGEGGGDGHGGTRGRRKQSCSVGQIFCCFIRFSVNRLALARTGVRRGVLKRARARERNGHRQLPGLHFAVIICTNSGRGGREGGGERGCETRTLPGDGPARPGSPS